MSFIQPSSSLLFAKESNPLYLVALAISHAVSDPSLQLEKLVARLVAFAISALASINRSCIFPSCFLDLLLDWKQNAREVIVKLNLGSGALKTEEVETFFTDTSCIVKLPGGW